MLFAYVSWMMYLLQNQAMVTKMLYLICRRDTYYIHIGDGWQLHSVQESRRSLTRRSRCWSDLAVTTTVTCYRSPLLLLCCCAACRPTGANATRTREIIFPHTEILRHPIFSCHDVLLSYIYFILLAWAIS